MTEQTEQPENQQFKAIFDDIRHNLKYYEQSKQQKIQEGAKRLVEAGMPEELVCGSMTRELEGYASKSYIKECLKDEYKNSKKVKKIVPTIEPQNGLILENNLPEDNIEKDRTENPIIDNQSEYKNISEEQLPPKKGDTFYDDQVKQIWNQKDSDSNSDTHTKLNNSFPQDLITKIEHDREIAELKRAIDFLKAENDKKYERTERYQEQERLIEVQKSRISELEDIETKTIQEFSFRNASEIAATAKSTTINLTQKVSQELELAASRISKLFLEARNVKRRILFSHDQHMITGWRIE